MSQGIVIALKSLNITNYQIYEKTAALVVFNYKKLLSEKSILLYDAVSPELSKAHTVFIRCRTTIRFQTSSQNGKPVILWDKPEVNSEKKKFGYKAKTNRIPLRSKKFEDDKAKLKPPRPISKSNGSERKTTIKQQQQHQQQQQQVMKGSVTLSQKQLDAILTTIGTLTEENAKLQVALETEPASKEEKSAALPLPESTIPPPSVAETTINSTHTKEYEDVQTKGNIIQNETPKPPLAIPKAHMTLAEKKRLEWEKEKDQANSNWDPWGRPGCGAKNATVNTNPIRNNTPPASRTGAERIHVNPTSVPGLESASPSVPQSRSQPNLSSNRGTTTTPNQVAPAAIRSSFVIGGAAPDESRFDRTKEQEKKLWLEELNMQREEQRRKKEMERKLKNSDEPTWAEPRKSVSNTDQTTGYVLNSYTSPPSNTEHSYLRGANVHLDEVTKREMDEKRRRHLEHQEAIKAQVEEKLRKKQEEKDRQMREEMEIEKKLAEERDALKKQQESEQMKARTAAQQQAERIRQLEEAMKDAATAAERDKREKRLKKLQRSGHDTARLSDAYATERSDEIDFPKDIEEPKAFDLPPATSRSREFGVQANLNVADNDSDDVQIEYKALPTPPIKVVPKPKENTNDRRRVTKQSEKAQRPTQQRPPPRNNPRNKTRDNHPKRELVSKKPSPPQVRSVKPKSPPVPSVHNRKKTPPVMDAPNEFVPFIRSVNVLDPSVAEDPLPVSREQSSVVRGRKAYKEGQQPAKYGTEMLNRDDPIFNPGLVKDNPTLRQSRILQHLSDLRRGLLLKQREAEVAMPSVDS
ncbi:DgyrCDS2961 [Dimorphilus gyrociliatus]|uniref:DgyrCDS2961 n=1 Tax=Dimorphilus gyrociliatus TaxID=2664684 RepID=A0A7I8VDJ7_9ANNE|nr:DgyrCDS2961 [Dimorphilus gyrociliatus]